MPQKVRFSGIGSGTFGGTQSAAYACTVRPAVASAITSVFFICTFPKISCPTAISERIRPIPLYTYGHSAARMRRDSAIGQQCGTKIDWGLLWLDWRWRTRKARRSVLAAAPDVGPQRLELLAGRALGRTLDFA